MEINKKSSKELKELFRKKVCNKQYASRETLLAYAFVRNYPYIVLEKKINEDSFGSGRNTFLRYLSRCVSAELWIVAFGSGYYDTISPELRKNDSDKYAELVKVKQELDTLVHAWIMKKYENTSEEITKEFAESAA